ncbi:peroxide stress protein YaaA [Corynebacterium yudongzhengii]|uniref:Peroxide stress protein YaaA n=1 Tax=Corynebacterium yudongzhengii TaxID=2080740 RepID=A0A2U1T672_9CORY|nr:peroxide stress protein YaaA [Corynebacterium yudongzhengii]AWB81705.1 peroxide stress protein YaaA [Corynebacterium yudongzhengii]PWC01492.1 peroxide stress protein YaaA [Corynebacterium yudongzhengii]
MFILLPPSETKAPGGDSPALDLEGLSFSSLNPIRGELIDELRSLSVDEALEVLNISEKLRPEAEANQKLLSAPTMPAIFRYTGVLYDALDAATLKDTSQLGVGSALFGLLRADDLIPHYRLSANTKLGGRTLKSRWGQAITEALEDLDELVVDLRSTGYRNLGKLKDAVTVRVITADTRKVVSHFNKHYKGELARVLATASATDAAGIAEIAEAAGMTVEYDTGTEITLVVERN